MKLAYNEEDDRHYVSSFLLVLTIKITFVIYSNNICVKIKIITHTLCAGHENTVQENTDEKNWRVQ